MKLDDKVQLEIDLSTLAILISGLYISFTGISSEAIPPSLFIEVAEQVSQYLPKWDYSVISLEEWIKTSLIIAPNILFSEEELEEYKNNEIFLERRLGNVVLIATGGINFE